jgi:rhamnogalacturonan endolyase
VHSCFPSDVNIVYIYKKYFALMISDLINTRLLQIVLLILLSSCSGNVIQTTVFEDGFQDLEPGSKPEFKAADPAVFFDPAFGILGKWKVASSLRQEGFKDAWVIRNDNEQNYLAQTFTNLNEKNSPLSLVDHPMVVSGDSLWSDFTIDVEFTPEAKFDKCGVVFGYHPPSDFYFFGVEGNTLTLKYIQHPVTPLRPIEKILDFRPLVWTPGDRLQATISIRRNKATITLNDSLYLHAEGLKSTSGKIGLISDVPAKFHRVEVKLLRGEQRKLDRRSRQLERRAELFLSDFPEMVRWKQLSIAECGSNQNLRLGDLTGDGNKELVFVRPGSGGGIRAITAMNLDGEVLWRHGSPASARQRFSDELPFQIHDLDGDGSREVIYFHDGWIRILDGASGKLLRRKEVPGSSDIKSLVFADLVGAGKDRNLILSDREHSLLAFNEKLELMWRQLVSSGSHPLVYDMDKDGRHEIMMGYSVMDPEGKLIYDLGAYIGDQCNGVSVCELSQGESIIPCLVYAAGDWGLLYYDFNGQLVRQNILGHVSYLGVAELDVNAPGLELLTSNRWGTSGLVNVMNAQGSVIAGFLPEQGISRCLTVNWKGDGEEFLMVSADTLTGGLFSWQGLLAVQFPRDGHPAEHYMAADLTGDARDEILVWDYNELWIYTQEDNPRMGNTYAPHRIPLYNYSMHQMNRSLPGW